MHQEIFSRAGMCVYKLYVIIFLRVVCLFSTNWMCVVYVFGSGRVHELVFGTSFLAGNLFFKSTNPSQKSNAPPLTCNRLHMFFQPLSPGARFPMLWLAPCFHVLGIGSFDCDFPRFSPVTCFPMFVTVSGCIFSRTSHRPLYSCTCRQWHDFQGLPPFACSRTLSPVLCFFPALSIQLCCASVYLQALWLVLWLFCV